MEAGDLNPYGPDFAVSLVDPFSTLRPKLWCGVIKNLFLTPVSLYEVLKRHKLGAVGPAVMAGLCWVGWVVLIIVEIVNINVPDMHLDGIYSLGWVFFLGFVTIITATRANIRSHYGINGNPIEDFFAALLVYPCVMVQLETVSEVNGIAPMMPDNRDAHLSTVNVINNKNHD